MNRRKINGSGKWSPLNELYPYQRKIVEDQSRFKIISCSRQCGKSTVFAFEAAMDSCLHNGAHWFCVSRGQRQSREWLEKAKLWAKLWSKYVSVHVGLLKLVRVTKTEISFSNGSRITALPANPDTIRGDTGNIILDEFAYHEHPDEIWAAMLPSISSEINGRKLRVRIASTVAGKGNLFWKILNGEVGSESWSRHIVTVEDAVKDGFKIDIKELRAGIADDDVWLQEYMCQPVDSTTALFTYDLIQSCESDEATNVLSEDLLSKPGKRFVMGVDIGRSKDLTVFWTCEIGVYDKLITREILLLDKMPLQEQQDILFRRLEHNSVKCAYIDGTGMGHQMAESAEKKFGSRAVCFAFTEASKRDLFVGMQYAFQQRKIVLPKGDSKLREDLHAMQRLYTLSGRVLFRAPSNKDGHSDRATALALCIMAAGKAKKANCGAQACDVFRRRDELREQGIDPRNASVYGSYKPCGMLDAADPYVQSQIPSIGKIRIIKI